MSINTQIPAEQWVEFFDTFTDGNKGRLIDLAKIPENISRTALSFQLNRLRL